MTQEQARKLIGQRRIVEIAGEPNTAEVTRVRYSLVLGRGGDDLTIGVIVSTLGLGARRSEFPLGYWETLPLAEDESR